MEGSVMRVLVLVDEANFRGSARTLGRRPDFLKLNEFLASELEGRRLIETAVYVGLPPEGMPEFSDNRERRLRFVHWLRTNGFLPVTHNGAPAGDGRYDSNVDVLLALDGLELAAAMKPDIVVLVSGDADFAPLAVRLRRMGIWVEAATIPQALGSGLRTAVNSVVDLTRLFSLFEPTSHAPVEIGSEEFFDEEV